MYLVLGTFLLFYFAKKYSALQCFGCVVMCWFFLWSFAHTAQYFIEARIYVVRSMMTIQMNIYFKFTFILLLPSAFFSLFNIRHTLSKKVNRMRVCWFDTKKRNKKLKEKKMKKLWLFQTFQPSEISLLDWRISRLKCIEHLGSRRFQIKTSTFPSTLRNLDNFCTNDWGLKALKIPLTLTWTFSIFKTVQSP